MSEEAPEFTANVERPVVLDDPEKADWFAEADIVVVGFGGAGAVASIQGLEGGASVIAIDRFDGGGATLASGGVVYAGGTRFQKEAGYDDSAEEMYKYLRFEGVPVRDETLKRFCDSSSENIEWLVQQGVTFGSTAYEERIAYPPDPYYLYFTGMEKFRGAHAYVAPRGHRTVGKGPTGRFYFPPLKASALKKGLRLIQHAPARRLVVDRDGTVLGVEVQLIPQDLHEKHSELFKRVNPYKILNGADAEIAVKDCAVLEQSAPPKRVLLRARRAVILASGGYNYNLEMFARYRPVVRTAYKELVRGGSMGCDGSGIELGVTAGGATSHMAQMFVTKAISPPHDFIHGVLVNLEGKRFVSEDAYLGNVGLAIAEQSLDGTAWLILDSDSFYAGVRQAAWPPKNLFSWWGLPAVLNIVLGGTRWARTLDALAGKLGINAGQLARTMAEFNANAARGVDPAFNKLLQHLRPQKRPPFFAVNLSLRNKWGFSGTMPYGGLTVDEDTGAVTRSDGSIILGLYAAGRTAVGVCSESNFSGLSIADTVFSGRRAARSAVMRNAVPASMEVGSRPG